MIAYQDECATLYRGDCLDILPTLPEASIDLVLTDPPYGTTRNKWDKPVDLDRWWPAIERVAKPNAAILMFAQAPFDKALAMSRIRRFRYEWIWEKPAATGFLNAAKMPMKAHENVLVFYRRLPPYFPQMGRAENPEWGKVLTRGTQRSTNYGGSGKSTEWSETGKRYPRSVIRFSTELQSSLVHPTQKPVDLLRYLIRTYSAPGDVVLDAFAGSGSTGVAARKEGRRFVGIEREEKYVEIAADRLREASAQPPLFREVAS